MLLVVATEETRGCSSLNTSIKSPFFFFFSCLWPCLFLPKAYHYFLHNTAFLNGVIYEEIRSNFTHSFREVKEHFQTDFYEVSKILTPEPGRNPLRKENYRPISFININTKGTLKLANFTQQYMIKFNTYSWFNNKKNLQTKTEENFLILIKFFKKPTANFKSNRSFHLRSGVRQRCLFSFLFKPVLKSKQV